jgi:hypothetical protein
VEVFKPGGSSLPRENNPGLSIESEPENAGLGRESTRKA